MKIILFLALLVLASVISVNTAYAESLFPLSIDNPVAGDTLFGFNTAIDGNYLLVSSLTDSKITDEFNNEVSKKTGKVFLFECNALPKCTLVESFSHPNPQLNDGYGLSVAIDWPFVVIGAPDTGKDFNNNNRIDDNERTVGEVFVYHCSSSSCKLIQTISSPSLKNDEFFGYSLALSGNNLVIGNWREIVDGKYGVGKSYFYTCFDSGCTLRDTISNPTPEAEEYFGLGIDIDGDNLIIGANNAKVDNISGAGMAYFYNCSSNTCKLLDTISNPTPDNRGQNSDRFGMRASISGTTVVISAPHGDSEKNLDEGEVYLYDCKTQACKLTQTIKNPTPVTDPLSNNESFGGMGLDLSNNYLLVSDYHAAVDVDGSGKIESDEEAIGEAYLYDCSGNTCKLIVTLENHKHVRGGSFGVSATMDSPNRILIGAHGDNIAYLFTDIQPVVEKPVPVVEKPVPVVEKPLSPTPTAKMLSDGTKVSISTSPPTKGEKMKFTVEFENSEHVNYDIMLTQNGKVIFDDFGVHSHDGINEQETISIGSSNPVDITITFKGYGINDPKTGPIGEKILFSSNNTQCPSGQSLINGKCIVYEPTRPTSDSPYEIKITPASGSGTPSCETTSEGCFIPKYASVAVGGKVVFSNTDTVAHTFTAGTASEGPSGAFDSGLVIDGSSYEWTPTTAGEFPYYDMMHPWMEGTIFVGQSPYPIPEPESEIQPEDNIDLKITIDNDVYDINTVAVLDISLTGTSDPQNVAFDITDPRGTTIITRSVMVDPDNSVSFEFKIDENFKAGDYKISATTNGDTTAKATASFKVKSQYNSFKITSVEVTDQQGNPSNLQAGETGFIKVNLEATKSITTLVTVNLFDSDLTSIGIGSVKTTLSSGTSEIVLSFMIPKDVALGEADIYVNAFSDWPSSGGVPLTKEFAIQENIQ